MQHRAKWRPVLLKAFEEKPLMTSDEIAACIGRVSSCQALSQARQAGFMIVRAGISREKDKLNRRKLLFRLEAYRD